MTRDTKRLVCMLIPSLPFLLFMALRQRWWFFASIAAVAGICVGASYASERGLWTRLHEWRFRRLMGRR